MQVDGYAFRNHTGEIDFESISATPEGVRAKYLEITMGWRFRHPERYDQDEVWARLQKFGNVVPVCVTETKSAETVSG